MAIAQCRHVRNPLTRVCAETSPICFFLCNTVADLPRIEECGQTSDSKKRDKNAYSMSSIHIHRRDGGGEEAAQRKVGMS
jgi:hypothetical protein